MAILSSHSIQNYYQTFAKIEVTFNKEVIKALGLLQEDVYLKIAGFHIPCVLYSSSFETAKVIVSFKPEHLEKLKAGHQSGMLHLGFKSDEKTQPLKFFFNIRVKGYNRYSNQRQDLFFVSLEITQKPPEDYIAIIGQFLEININSHRRADERIPVKEDNIKKIGFASTTTLCYIDRVPRRCLVRDLSFGGAQLLVPGLAKFLKDKPIVLRLIKLDNGETIDLNGVIVRSEELENRKDLATIGVQFHKEKVPMVYKTLLNNYLKSPQR